MTFWEACSSNICLYFIVFLRVVVNRQANKLWFLVKVVPQITLGDVKVCDGNKIMKFDEPGAKRVCSVIRTIECRLNFD